MSDEQLDAIRRHAQGMANVLVELFLTADLKAEPHFLRMLRLAPLPTDRVNLRSMVGAIICIRVSTNLRSF